MVFLQSAAWSPAADPLDRDRDGLTDTEELEAGTNPRSPDTDGDGLLDGWEVKGYESMGFHEPLPLYGADPLRKDVFVEVDWMASSGESIQLAALIAYQAAADVTRAFRRSGTGIEIHFDLGPRIESLLPPGMAEADMDFSAFQVEPDDAKMLPYQDRFASRPAAAEIEAGSSRLSLYEVYTGGRWFRPSRRNIFYYVIFAEMSGPDAGRGTETSHPYSDDFSDALARRDGLIGAGPHAGVVFRKPAADLSPEFLRYQYSVSLFHELGHAFGLGHGGALPSGGWDSSNYKPNYPSIMNYRYMYCGTDWAGGAPVMDFSHGALKLSLSEKALIEPLGMGKVLNNRLLDCARVERLPLPEFPSNIDWNRDGQLTGTFVIRDLNENGRIDEAPLSDHDDWGKLRREGFDGIGTHAYGDRGMSAAAGADVRWLSGDYDGNGLTDICLFRGDAVAWAMASGIGRLSIDPSSSRRGSLGGWSLSPGDGVLAGDFFGEGRDLILLHDGNELALLDQGAGTPRIVWHLDGGIGQGPLDLLPAWSVRDADRFLAASLSSPERKDIVVTDGYEVGIFTASDAGRSLSMAWTSGGSLRTWTRGEPPAIQRGRSIAGGGESFLVSSSSALVEVLGPAGAPAVRPIDRAGVIPPAEWMTQGWALSPEDTFLSVDLDGDGTDELFLKGSQRMGVVRWEKDSGARLVWLARGRIGEVWPMSRDPMEDRVYPGRFLPGAGSQLVVSNGQSWVTLTWPPGARTLEVLSIQNGYLLGEEPAWDLRRGQAVLAGKFLELNTGELLVKGESSIILAGLEAGGFRPLVRFDGALGDWPIEAGDRFSAAQLDADPELEIIAVHGDRIGVLDILPGGASQVMRLDVDSLELENIPRFLRGDPNGDGEADISDVVMVLGHLFLGFEKPDCEDAADVDDSGDVDVSDPIFLLSFLFSGTRLPPPPGPFVAGMDPTLDALGCER